MKGWFRTVGHELRHGAPVSGFAFVGVLVGVLLWSKGFDWGARWNHLGFALRDYVIVLGPVSVALGVWSGGRLRRTGVNELLASTRRSALARASSEVTALAVACYLGVLVGAASAAWTIVLVGGYGTWAAALYLAGSFPTVLAYVSLGYLLGRSLSWRVAAPIAGVLTYVTLGVVSFSSTSRMIPLGGGELGGTYGDEFDIRALVWSALGLLIAATLALAVASVERRPAPSRSWTMTALVAVIVLAVTVPTTATAAADHYHRPVLSSSDVVCTKDDRPRVCVLSEDRHLLMPVTVRARKVLDRFHGIADAPTWAGPDGLDLPPGQARRLDVEAGDTSPWGRPNTDIGGRVITVDSRSYVSPARYCRTGKFGQLPGDSGEVFFRRSTLVAYFVDAGDTLQGENLNSRSVEARFRSSTDAQRRVFTARVIAAARGCDLKAVVAADAALARP